MKFMVKCSNCQKSYVPYGSFMIEKCYCPYCGYQFYIVKGSRIIRILYAILTFTALWLIYAMIRPHTSLMIAVFWLCAMAILKIGTYIMHIILLITWYLFSHLRKKIFKKRM